MTVLSFFHNSVNGDRKYEADDFAKHTSTIIGDGIVEGLKVNYTSAYAYTIDTGKAIVMGRSVVNDAQIATAIGTPVNGDLWSVVVRMDLTARSASIETILGTTYQDDNAIKQIPLATILVGTNTLTITDKRSFSSFKSNKISIKNSALKYTHTLGGEFSPITFKEGSDTTGIGMAIGSGGTTIVGGGESANSILNSTLVPDAITEKTIVSSDYDVVIMTGMQDVGTDPTTGKRSIFNANGDLNIGGNNVDLSTCTIRYTSSTKTIQIYHWTGSAVSDTVVLEVGDIKFKNAPWANVTLTNGAVLYSPTTVVKYKKQAGIVYLKGSVKGLTAIATNIGTLPAGFRPVTTGHSWAAPTSGKNFARWTIGTDGVISLENVSQTAAPTAADWFCVDTSFTTDD